MCSQAKFKGMSINTRKCFRNVFKYPRMFSQAKFNGVFIYIRKFFRNVFKYRRMCSKAKLKGMFIHITKCLGMFLNTQEYVLRQNLKECS